MVENFEFRAPYNGITFDFYSSNEEIYVKNEDYLLGAYGIRFNTFERKEDPDNIINKIVIFLKL